ncbi:MAG: CHAT domain-containing protein [Chloracidobacterium sp.]|nr:CHAT domain-containing protein [Chloracidobacterium sp.]MDW8216913.1 CHAT domain-containing tetratricopeptide repeat protein [Acidobacteriota bacterium]
MRRLSTLRLLLGLVLVTPLFGQTLDKPAPLTAETSVERELPSEGVHTYEVKLNRNDFLHVTVEQHGADVVVKILDPTGKLVFEQDSPNGRYGPEDAAFVAPSDGVYQVVIAALSYQGKVGRYTLRVTALRPAGAAEQALAAKQAQAQEARAQTVRAERLRQSGQYDEALKLALEALKTREDIYGPENPFVADTLTTVAAIYYDKGDYAQSEAWYRRALAMREKTLGPNHHHVALTLNNLGLTLQRKGDYAEAEQLYQRSIQVDEAALGPNHEDTLPTINNLASLYQERGRYAQAAALYQRAVAGWEAARGPDSLELAYSLNNLGALQRLQSDYTAAEPMFQRALGIFEKGLGPEHPNVAILLNNLAEVLRLRGDYDRAEPLYRRGLAILEKALGPTSPNVASLLTNLGLVAIARRDYSSAEATFMRALAVYEKSLGGRHPLYAACLNNLADTFRLRGDFERAERLYRQASVVSEQALGPTHPSVARSLGSLGWVRRERKDYAAADQLFHQALDIQTKAFGPEHPEVIQTLNNLAILSQQRGEPKAALAFQIQANAARERELSRNLVAGSERQKFLYLALAQEETDRTLDLHLRYLPTEAAAAQAALTVILQRKGRALDAMTDAVAVLRKRGTPEDAKLLDDLTALKGQISVLTQRGPGQAGPDAHRAELKALGERADALEAEISRRSAQYRARFAPVTLAAVTQAVPADAVLVEYVVYRPTDVERGTLRPARYAAYALKQDGTLRWADLGDAATIDQAVADLRAALAKPVTPIKTVKRAARRLAALTVEPLRPFLSPARRLLLSPDGMLNLVPFEALSDARGKYLVEQFDITYLTSGRDLLTIREASTPSDLPPVVFAAPDYGHGDAVRLAGMTLPPLVALTGTEAEAQVIQNLFPDAAVQMHAAATGDALRELRRPRFLHLATHGAFLEDARSETTAAPSDPTRAIGLGHPQAMDLEKTRSENPLLRSYLFFAGANQSASGSVLTALEAANLDLWGTQLVTLSACQTGVGAVRVGDGVYGMRRAFVLAGAQTQVMSLWSVSDQGTKALMTGFYARLKRGEGRSAALRNARLEMLRRARYRHPFYWASFILTGDWRPL